MKNCEMKLEGNILTITVDISKEFGNHLREKVLLLVQLKEMCLYQRRRLLKSV